MGLSTVSNSNSSIMANNRLRLSRLTQIVPIWPPQGNSRVTIELVSQSLHSVHSRGMILHSLLLLLLLLLRLLQLNNTHTLLIMTIHLTIINGQPTINIIIVVSLMESVAFLLTIARPLLVLQVLLHSINIIVSIAITVFLLRLRLSSPPCAIPLLTFTLTPPPPRP